MAVHRPVVLQVATSTEFPLQLTYPAKDGHAVGPHGLYPVTLGPDGMYTPDAWGARILGKGFNTGVAIINALYPPS